MITSTYRDDEYQTKLYNQGRITPGKIVTNAKAGKSAHNHRQAFDFAPLISGKIPWNDTKLWIELGKIGKECGLDWAGDWKSFRELAHFQLPGFKIP